jgi:hypothetical protein
MRREDSEGGGLRYRRRDVYQGQHRPTEDQRTVSEREATEPAPRGRFAPVRHRAAPPWRALAARRPVVAALLILVGIAGLIIAVSSDNGRPAGGNPAALAAAVRVPSDRQRQAASRSERRTPPQVGASIQPSLAVSAVPSASPSPSVSPSPTPVKAPSRPTPVGGLSQVQMDYAATIVAVGEKLGLPKQAYVIAVATALTESQLLDLANWGVAESLDLAHDGVGGDHDSVGLFQQRPSSGWGTVEELMDPAISASKFYQALEQIPGWQGMPVTVAAQTVQVSAFPDAYAAQASLATLVVDALT